MLPLRAALSKGSATDAAAVRSASKGSVAGAAAARSASKGSAADVTTRGGSKGSAADAATAARGASNASTPDPAAARFVAEGEAWQSHFEAPRRPCAKWLPCFRAMRKRPGARPISIARWAPTTRRIQLSQRLWPLPFPDRRRATRMPWRASAISIWTVTGSPRAPLVERMAAAEPGNSAGYLSAATVYWDYFQYNDALRMLAAGRQKLADSTLFA